MPRPDTTQPLDWSADRWELYASEPGAAAAAARLNAAATGARDIAITALQNGESVPDAAVRAYSHLSAAMFRDGRFGAADTEPDYHAQWYIAMVLADRLHIAISADNAPALWRVHTPVTARKPS